MARKGQGTPDESTKFLRTVGLADPESASEFEELTPKGTKFRWTVRIRKFCHALVEQNGITIEQAARQAGYSDPGPYASYLLKISQVQAYIKELLQEQMATYAVTPETVVGFWTNVLKGDPYDYLEYDRSKRSYKVKAVSKLSAEQRRRVKKIKITDTAHGQRVEIELHDPVRVARELAIAMGMMHPDEDVKADDAEELARRTWETLAEMEDRDGITKP